MKSTKPTTLQGDITISRPMGGGDPYISIEVNDASSHIRFLSVRVDLTAFMLALTGSGYQPCTFELRATNLVGSTAENKTETVPFDYFKIGRDDTKAIKAALAPFEVDGWKGDVDDMSNPHRRAKGGQSVTFRRHVNAKGEPIS